MKLDKNSKFIRLLELTLKQWKDEHKIERPFFYNIDFKNNNLLLYSDDPSKLLRERYDLLDMLDIANIRFRDVQLKQFLGGTIY